MSRLKIGDKVKYTSGAFGDSKYNPLWGGECGNVIGTIVCNDHQPVFIYKVDWGNSTNSYKDGDVELYNTVPEELFEF